jgi:hypothetical protein
MKKKRDAGNANDKSRPAANKEVKDGMSQTPATDGVATEDVIGAGLKRLFDDVVKEPIPPEFLDLLNRIDRTSE